MRDHGFRDCRAAPPSCPFVPLRARLPRLVSQSDSNRRINVRRLTPSSRAALARPAGIVCAFHGSHHALKVPTIPLGRALVFAFLGGIILNLMPCVFPILAMKAAGFAAGFARGQARAHAISYTAGVVAETMVVMGQRRDLADAMGEGDVTAG